MITTSELNEFVGKVEAWRHLNVEEQENVVSEALERYCQKSKVGFIPNPVGWLLRAARKIKYEVWRDRKKRCSEVAAIIELRSSDRRVNGTPRERNAIIPVRAPAAIEDDSARTICLALKSLPPVERRIVEMCAVQELFPAEVARELCLGRSTVKSKFARSLQRLSTVPALRELVGFEQSNSR